MDDSDPEQIERDLMKAAQFPWPFERLHQEGLAWESAWVAHPRRARWIVFSIPLRMVVLLGAIFVMVSTEGWVEMVASLVLLTFTALGVTGPLRRAQAYRNGWLDRGRHDVTEHELVCGDPVGQQAFSWRMVQLNMESL